MGNGISGLFVPLLVYSIDTFGWQTCLRYFAVGLLLISIPACLVFRSRPEDYGMQPDGKSKPEHDNQNNHSTPIMDGMDLRQAMKSRTFWLLGISSFFQIMAWMAFSTHLMPYFSSLGIDRSLGGKTAMAVPLVSLVTRFPFGWISDIFDKRYILAGTLVLNSIALFIFWLIDGNSMIMIVMFIFTAGVATGGLMPVRIPIYREYFGTGHFGKIYGIGNLFFTLGMIIGSPLGGWVYDTLGYYNPLWLALSITTAFSVVLVLLIPKIDQS